MKKFLKVLLCLILVFSLMPKEEVKAEDRVTNIQIDSSGTATWDAYPGASYYGFSAGYWNYSKHGLPVSQYKEMNYTSLTETNFEDHLSYISAYDGDFYFMVWAYDDNGDRIAFGYSNSSYHHTSLGDLSTPILPAWDLNGFTVATWNGVENAEKYRLKLYRDGEEYTMMFVYGTYVDLDGLMVGENHEFFFTVSAMGYGYSESDTSVKSPVKNGAGRALMRVAGKTRYETSMNVATATRNILHEYQPFDTVFVATGKDFPDALSGAFLANELSAPLIMIDEKSSAEVVQYINENLSAGGTVYILGGTGVVKDEWLKGLDTSNIKRLSGKNRYGTNLAILDEYRSKAPYPYSTYLVCTGKGFADALSCSALDFPMLLVGNSLNNEQKEWLGKLDKSGTYFYIVGGTGAVSEDVENALEDYGTVITRISGKNRYETSAKIASFSGYRNQAVIATGKNFPDGLSAGPLAHALSAPLLLVDEGKTQAAFEVCDFPGITVGYIVGGQGAVSDETACATFGVSSLD